MSKNLISCNPILKFKQGLVILKFQKGGQSKYELINDGPTTVYRRRKKLFGGYVWEHYVAGNWIPIEKEVKTKDGYILKLNGTKVHETARANNTRKAYGEKQNGLMWGPNDEYRTGNDPETGEFIMYDRKTGAVITNMFDVMRADAVRKRWKLEQWNLQQKVKPQNKSLESTLESQQSLESPTAPAATSTPATTKVVNTRIVLPKKLIISVKTPELWLEEYNNFYNNLSINQLEYLDSLGIDLSSAASILEGINNYYGKPILAVDNKFGPITSRTINTLLNNMPQGFRNPIPPEANQYKYDFETPLNSNLFIVPERGEMTVLKRGGLISRNSVLRFKLGKVIKKFLSGGLQPWAGYYTVGNWPRSTRKISTNSNKLSKISSLAEYIKRVKSGQINPQESITFIPPTLPSIIKEKEAVNAPLKPGVKVEETVLKNSNISNSSNANKPTPASRVVRPVVRKTDWETEYQKVLGNLTLTLKDYLTSLGANLSDVKSLLKVIGTKDDGMFGNNSNSALIAKLAEMPKDFGISNKPNTLYPEEVKLFVNNTMNLIQIDPYRAYSNYSGLALKNLGFNNYNTMIDYVLNNPQNQFSKDLTKRFGDVNTWNQADVEQNLGVSGNYRGSRAGDFGDIARSMSTWAGSFNGTLDGKVDLALRTGSDGIVYSNSRVKDLFDKYAGKPLLSRNPVTRFKKGGFVLKLQGGKHIVDRGESLSLIAQQYGMSLKDLLKLNPEIKNPDKIYAGQTIKVNGTRKNKGITVGTTHKPVKYISNNGRVKESQMKEIVVNAPRVKIDPKNKKTMFGLLPSKENPRMFTDMYSGQIYLTDNQGNIIGSTFSEEAAKKMNFSYYHGKLLKEANRQAAVSEAVDEINKSVGRYDQRKVLSEEKLKKDIASARNLVVNVALGVLNYPNHVILGPIAAAARDDYSLKDYAKSLSPKEGFGILNSIGNQIVGLGDVLNVELPELRFGLNFINPTSVATTAASYNPGLLVLTGATKSSYGRMLVPVELGGQISRNIGLVARTPRVRNVNLSMGYRATYHPVSTFKNISGGSRPLAIKYPEMPLYRFTESQMKVVPVNYMEAPTYSTPLKELPTPDEGYVEVTTPTPWHLKWFETGVMPASNSLELGTSEREGVYQNPNSIWIGLEGHGIKNRSNLGNTSHEPRGYNTKFY